MIKSNNDMPDPEKIAKLLDAVADKIPAILGGIRDSIYSKEAGEHFGEAVGAFYKKLIEQGIPEKEAMEMTKGYMISLRDLVKPSLKMSEGKGKEREEE